MGAASSSIISSTASLAGSAISAYSATQSSRYSAQSARLSAMTQQTNYNAQADMAEANARLAEHSARSARDQGRHEIARLTLQHGQLQGQQRAKLAASGVDLSVGSAVEQQASADVLKNIDTNTIELNAMQKAWGFENQALNYRNQAAMSRITGQSIDPGLAYQSSMLTSAPGVASSWLNVASAFGNAFSSWGGGTQTPAPVEDRAINYTPYTPYYNATDW